MEGDYKTKSYNLKEIPEDVYGILLRKQVEKKIKCKCQYSIESVIYAIIRDSAKFDEEEKKK